MEKRLDIDNRAENALTRQDKTRQDKTRQDYHSRSDRQYGQEEQGQHENNIRQRSDLHVDGTHRQRTAVSPEKVFRAYKSLNSYNGLCRTIKSQYYKNGIDNFMIDGSWGATAVIRRMEK